MLSILIPTYNYNCHKLVKDLQIQAETLKVPYEILVADDASDEEMKKENRQINFISCCHYIELKENQGRARIRNLLGETARYEYLLFIDSDAGIRKNDFLFNYIKAAADAPVVCGGLLHQDYLPSPKVSLRYYYEKEADLTRGACYREKNPYSRFTTFSFLIHKDIFLGIKFDESFVRYGCEDTLFGVELKKRNIPILHIDNPLYHLGLEENEIFLRKAETSIENLFHERNKLKAHSRVYILYSQLCKIGLRWPLWIFFRTMHKFLKKNLLSTRPDLKVFALYKLGYLCYLDKKNQ